MSTELLSLDEVRPDPSGDRRDGRPRQAGPGDGRGAHRLRHAQRRQHPGCQEPLASAKERLALGKPPREVRLIEALPRNAVGTVAKRELRERAKQ